MDGNKFISSVIQIVDNELDKRSQDVICIVKSVNDDGTVNIVIPPDFENTITNVKNESNRELTPGCSALLYKINNRINNSFIISGSGKQKESGSSTLVKTNEKLESSFEDGNKYSRILQTVDEISMTVGETGRSVASLSIKADEIASSVEAQDGRISRVSQKADSIASTVQNHEGEISTLSQSVNDVTAEVRDARGGSSSLSVALDGIKALVVAGGTGNLVFRQSTKPTNRPAKSGETPPALMSGDLWYNTSSTKVEDKYAPNTWFIWDVNDWKPAKDGELEALTTWKSGFTIEPTEITQFVEGNKTFLTTENKTKINEYDNRVSILEDGIQLKVSQTTFEEYQGAVSDEFTTQQGEIDIQKDKISLVVSEEGGQNVVNSASIIAGINSNGDSSVNIKADKIDMSGNLNVKGSYISSDYDVYAKNSVQAKDVYAEKMHVLSTTFDSVYTDFSGLSELIEVSLKSVTREPFNAINDKLNITVKTTNPIFEVVPFRFTVTYADTAIDTIFVTLYPIDPEIVDGEYIYQCYSFINKSRAEIGGYGLLTYLGERGVATDPDGKWFRLTFEDFITGYKASNPQMIATKIQNIDSYVSIGSNGIAWYTRGTDGKASFAPLKTVSWENFFNKFS